MRKENFTPTPNILFDQLLKELTNSEIKILLVIIRQTHGWIDQKTRKRKERDRISFSQFITKTGLSRRIISKAINSLCNKELIIITNRLNEKLIHPSERKGCSWIYYSSLLEQKQIIHHLTNAECSSNMCKKEQEDVQKVSYNKRNYTKRNLTKEKDFVHIKEVIDENKTKWNIN